MIKALKNIVMPIQKMNWKNGGKRLRKRAQKVLFVILIMIITPMHLKIAWL
jgi:hypothetical protein